VKIDAPSVDGAGTEIVEACLLPLPEMDVLGGCEGVKFVVVRETNRYWKGPQSCIERRSQSSTSDREILSEKVRELLRTSLREVSVLTKRVRAVFGAEALTIQTI
jgi:hypothetical protein